MWCELNELSKYVLQAYLDKAEELSAGVAQGHIDQVSGEIDEALAQGGYTVPEGGASSILTRICAVSAAWRTIGNITSLMDSEASSANEWLPLQKLVSRSEKELDLIRAGKLDPFPDGAAGGGVTVVTKQQIFDDDVWSTF